MSDVVPGSLSFRVEAGTGVDFGKLSIDARVTGGARGGGCFALPYQTAAWLGLWLRNPDKWAQFCPCSPGVLRCIHERGDATGRDVLVVELHGRLWFEIARSAAVQTAEGVAIGRPAEQVGNVIYAQAKLVEERVKAEAVIDSQAALFAAGIPRIISKDRRIFEEATKEAGFNHEMRQHSGTLRFTTLNEKPLIGLPTATQYAPGLSEFEFQQARIANMSPAQRKRALDRLKAKET